MELKFYQNNGQSKFLKLNRDWIKNIKVSKLK